MRMLVLLCLIVTLVVTWKATDIIATNTYNQAIQTHNSQVLPVSRRTGRVNPIDSFLHSKSSPSQAGAEEPVRQLGALVMVLEVLVGFTLLLGSEKHRRTLTLVTKRDGN